MAADGSITPTLIITTFLACFGSSMLYGYNLAILNGPGSHIRCFFTQTLLNTECLNKTDTNKTSNPVDKAAEHKIELLYSLTATLFVVFGAIGAFCTGAIADNIGRRNGLLFNHIFVIIGAIIASPTVHTRIPYLLYVGRGFIGFNCGVTIGLASIYLTEIAPQRVRGAIGACHQLAVTIGILLAMITGLKQLMNNSTMWAIAQGLTGVPAVISLCFLPFCPESPRFLYMVKGKEDDARKALAKFHSAEVTEELIEEMKVEKESTQSRPKFQFSQLFTSKDLRMPLAIAVLIQVMQQLSGINAVMSFSSTMFKATKISDDMIPILNIGLSVLNVICTIVSLPLLEKFGRRTLLLIPSVLLATCLLGLTISVNLVTKYTSMAMVSVILINLYVVGFAFGLGTITALLVAEVFRQEPRTAAYSVSQAVQWLINLVVSTTYPNLQKALGGYVFLLYLVVVVICWIFFFLFMPETKNRSFDDVARDLAFGNVLFKKNNVERLLASEEGKKPGNSGTSTPGSSKPQLVTKVDADDETRNKLLNDKDGLEMNQI